MVNEENIKMTDRGYSSKVKKFISFTVDKKYFNSF